MRNKHSHQKTDGRNNGRGINRYFQHLRHARILFGAEVIAGNGLHSLIQTHHNHNEEEYQTVDNTESSDSQIPSVLFQPFINKDDDKAGGKIHQEGSHTDGQRIKNNLLFQSENAFMKMQEFVLITKQLELPEKCDDLCGNRSDSRTLYSPAKAVNKNRIEYRINDHGSNRSIHRLLWMPCGTKYRIQAQVKMGDDISLEDNHHIVAGIADSRLTSPEEVKNRIEENQGKNRKSQSDDNI